MADQREYNKRYQLAYDLCKALLNRKLKQLGKKGSYQSEKTIQSVLGSFEVTKLIMHCNFNMDIYSSVLQEEIENTRKLFFPDLAKNRFIGIDNLDENDFSTFQDPVLLNTEADNDSDAPINISAHNMSNETLKNILPGFKDNRKLELIKKLFPDGTIPDITYLDPLKTISKSEIIVIYKHVLSGIEKSFPKNFLAVDGKMRCKVITKYLCEEIYSISTPVDLKKLDEYFFLENKLLNMLRFFNYSVNQILLNAFPDIIQPWENGRTEDYFWQEKQNRINATQWLVSVKLEISVKQAGKIKVNKSDFSKNGLSYLFNTYYNSVAKALSEAYPLLMPWQISSLPTEYWSNENAIQAIRWMFRRLDWQVDSLPKRYNLKELNRKTFSQFGLSGLFENSFNCNIYNLLSFVYPGKFKEWEFIQTNSSFWLSSNNRERFSNWLQDKFKIDILSSKTRFENVVELEEYRFFTSLNRYCAGDINNLAQIYAQDLAEANKSRILERRWEKLIKQERKTMLQGLLVDGFFYSMVKSQTDSRIDRLIRMKNRSVKYLSAN